MQKDSMRFAQIMERWTCQGWKRFLLLNGVLVDLSEFPHLLPIANTELKKAGIAGNVEDWQKRERKSNEGTGILDTGASPRAIGADEGTFARRQGFAETQAHGQAKQAGS